MEPRERYARVKSALLCWMGLVCFFAVSTGFAADVALSGVVGSRAVLVINGAQPVVLQTGQMADGVRLLQVDREAAVVDVGGRRVTLRLGEQVVQREGSVDGHVLLSDRQGHFTPQGKINGQPVRFLVDTGASLVSMGISDARRLGLDLSKAAVGRSQTANGVVRVRRVVLDSVQVGPMIVYNIEASVHDHDLPVVLLGMSFLSRMEVSQDGSRMTLRKRY